MTAMSPHVDTIYGVQMGVQHVCLMSGLRTRQTVVTIAGVQVLDCH